MLPHHLHHLRHDKMSDRETLLSMGFDPARVDCECVTFRRTLAFTPFVVLVLFQRDAIDYYVGALKATNNRGLQPAMDHLIENEGKSVPDLSSVSSTAASTRPAGGGDPMDEDDDLEAVRAVYGSGAGGSGSAQAEAEAKVR